MEAGLIEDTPTVTGRSLFDYFRDADETSGQKVIVSADRPIKDGAALIAVEMPLIAEDGGSVPIAVEVKSPMTPESHVKAIYILAEKNPRPLNVKVSLTPAAGQAFVATNLRLADSGPVRVVAEMSDGTVLMTAREVRVTVAGCAA